ncbi:nose resistant to fluoxetine protein 6-like [Epargyreus clarus]|uniref:nose resistant to fluoxetine protein 6-like n=1 Tax=Epargyreus clarus TaxID=520877 RepID=UPI003C2DAFE5
MSVLVVLLLISPVFGVIYDLHEEEHSRMPPIFNLDDYTNCLKETDGIYCTVQFAAISDEPSELLTMMQEYSKQYKTHYNHTSFQYGVCVTQKCKGYSGDKTEALTEALEEHLNETFWNEYKLKTQVTAYTCDGLDDGNIAIDTSDSVVGFLITSLLILNVIGSLSDFFFSKRVWLGKEYFLSFSIKRNWKKLVAPSSSLDQRFNQLKSLNGIKSLLMFSVILGHCLTPGMVIPENSIEIEKAYNGTFEYILINGSLVIQFFFFMTAFFLMYNTRRYSESNEINSSYIAKGLLMRLIRIMPAYAVVLGIEATWYRRFGSGPFWQTVSMRAVNDCRRNWWLHMLFLNNFTYNSMCLGTSWYIAADTQLYVFCLLICVLVKTDGIRRQVLSLLYIIGVMIPPAVTYFLDLEGRFILAPATTPDFFIQDPTYNELYVRWYTNLAASALGLIMGDLVYRWQLDEAMKKKIQAYKNFRLVYWSLLPLCLALIISGKYFYMRPYLDPWYTRVLFSLTVPPLFTFFAAVLLVGFVFEFEDAYRGFLEWEGWTVTSRLSYCAFILHFLLIRFYTSTKTSLVFVSPLTMVTTYTGITTLTFLLATPLWLFVETPLLQITNAYLHSKQKRKIS